MAAVFAGLVNNDSATDATSYATASITPTASALVIAFLHSTKASNADAVSSVTGNGLTWVQVATFTFGTDDSNRISCFRAQGSAPTAGAVTFDFGAATQTSASWSIHEWTGVPTNGTNGSGAVGNSATNEDTSGTTGSVEIALANTNNAIVTCVATGTAEDLVPKTGWTQYSDRGHINPTNRVATSRLAVSAGDVTPNWTWATSGYWGMMAVEIYAAPDSSPTAPVVRWRRRQRRGRVRRI